MNTTVNTMPIKKMTMQKTTRNSWSMKMEINKKVCRKVLLLSLVATAMNITACSSIPLIGNSRSANETLPASVTQRNVDERIQSESIENMARINIEYLNRDFSNTMRVEVHAFDSEVLLTGEVPSTEIKLTVQEMIASMPEVRAIYNELKVSRQHTFSYKAHDAYINSKLAQKIMRSKEISKNQIKLNAESGVIYVMGRVTEQQQNHLIQLANETPGVLELILLTKILPTVSLPNNTSSNILTFPQSQNNSQLSRYEPN